MHVRVGCEFAFEADTATPLVAQVLPRLDGPHTLVWERQRLDPIVASHQYLDQFGNRCWRLTVPVGAFTMRYDALVQVHEEPDPVDPAAAQATVDRLPDPVLL